MEMLTGVSCNDRVTHFMAMQKPNISAQLAYRMDQRGVSLSPFFQEQVLGVHQWLTETGNEAPPSLEKMYGAIIPMLLEQIDLKAVEKYSGDKRFSNDAKYRRQRILEFEDEYLRFDKEFFDTEFLIECACDAIDLQYTKLDTSALPMRRRIHKNPVQTFVMLGV